MLIFRILLAIFSFLRLSSSLTPGQQLTNQIRPMDMWVDPNDPNNATDDWHRRPTYHKTVGWDVSLYGGLPSYEATLALANAFFNWAVTQLVLGQPPRTVVVVVIFNPITSNFEASTVPHGPRIVQMLLERGRAPLWNKASSSYSNRINPGFCAEDGAEYAMETRANNGISGASYPDGTFMAVWGTFALSDRIGTECAPCKNKRGDRNIKGCQTTANNLGISYRSLAVISRQGEGRPNLDLQLTVPGPVPLDLAPIEQPVEPWDQDTELIDAMENIVWTGQGLPNAAAKRWIDGPDDHLQNSYPIAEKHKSPVYGWQPPRRDNTAESVIPSATYASTSWPTIATLHSFPTGESVSTLTDLSFKSLVATGPVSALVTLTSTASTASVTTAAPSISCSMQMADPDSGINSAFCICQSSATLPLLTLSSVTEVTQSCDYTTLPATGANITPTTALGPKTTNSKLCNVCSLAENNENACTSLSNCIPQTVQVTATLGKSSVHVGTLTGDQLYTSISNALTSLCPTVSQTTSSTQCQQTEPIQIKGIDFKNEDGSLNRDGLLEVLVDSSEYNDTKTLDAMIDTVARSVQVAASGKNCAVIDYLVPEKRRSLQGSFPRWVPTLAPRAEIPFIEHLNDTWCAAFQFYAVNYFNAYHDVDHAAGSTDWLYVGISFAVEPESQIFCEVMEALTPFLAVIAPEYIPEDFAMEGDIGISCDLGDENNFFSGGSLS